MPLGILRVCLACKHELDGMLSINQDVKEARRIMQEEVRAFVRRKPTGKSQSQNIVIEYESLLVQDLPDDAPRAAN